LGVIGVTLLSLCCATKGHAADRIYWTNFFSGTVQWADVEGVGVSHELNPGAATISPMGYGAGGAIDPVEGRYYWFNQIDQKINWANLDGSGGGDLEIGAATVDASVSYGLSIDPVGRRIYWGSGTSIEFANLDGSGGGTLDTGAATVASPYATTVYPALRRVYWVNGTNSGGISYASLDGSGGQNLTLSGTGPMAYPLGIAIDAAAQKVYWANDTVPGSISVANLDGSGSAEIPKTGVSLDSGPYGLAVDPEAARAYTAMFAGDRLTFLGTGGSGGVNMPIFVPKGSGPNFPVIYKEPKATSPVEINASAPPAPKFVKKKKRKAPSPLPKLIGSTISCSGGGFAPDLVEAHLYRGPVRITHAITRDGQEFSKFVTGLGPEPGILRPPPKAAEVGNYRCQLSGTNIAGTTTVTSPPVAIFKVAKVKLNRKKGTANVTLQLPKEAGSLAPSAKTKGVAIPSRKKAAGKTTITLRPKGKRKAKLEQNGTLATVVGIGFAPEGGSTSTLRFRITFKQR
jgi:hypothetical protein